MNALEERLSRLDLQLESTGSHLSDERLACVAQGSDPTSGEAGHLAGCDDCTEMLMAVGVGFEAALIELPGAEAWVQAPTPGPAGSSWGVLLGGGALLVSAAALWVALGSGDSVAPAPSPASTHVIAAAEATHPSTVSPTTARPWSANNAPSSVPPVVTTDPGSAPPRVAAPSARRAVVSKPRDRAAPGSTATPRGEMRVRGPRPLNVRPVDAPPRGSGYLRLAAKPPARVFLDGKFIGWTPLVDHRLIEGPHDVRLVYESAQARRKEERFRVVIEPDRIWRSLRRNLRR